MLLSRIESADLFSEPRGSCPVCDSAEVELSECNRQEFTDNFYLEALRTDLGISLETLRNQALVYECNQCATVYCDPWLRYEVASDVYNVIYGQHNRGWDALFGWIANEPIQSYQAMYELVQKKIGTIRSYAEYDCPFQGNLFFLREPELGELSRQEIFDASKQYLSSRQQNAEISADRENKPTLLKQRSKIALERLKTLRERLRESSVDRYLFYDATSLCWGGGCVGDGVSCKSLASIMLGTRVLTTIEAQKQKLKVDLAAIYNTLDHVADPLSTLDNLLDVARYVLIINHAQPVISKQHHFVLRPGLSSFLKRKGMSVVNLTEEASYTSTEINSDKIFLLISR